MSNIYRHIRAVRALAATLLPALVAAGCASMGNPSGGPRDEEPPRFVSANPPQGTAGVTPRRVTLDFDEIVNVKDAYSKVVVSPVGKETAKVSSNGRRVTVQLPDTLALTDIYGVSSGPFTHDFNVKPEEDYCALTFNITGRPDSVPAFVELLNQDKPVRTEPVADNAVTFRYLAPGKYYARIIFDWNGNGLYDTGDFDSLRQPDLAYYYPKAVNIKKNWEKTESWDIFAMTVDQQKPEAILKNKPEADKRRRAAKKNASQQTGEDEEDEEYFDPTRNPFDPNDRGRRNQNQRF